MAFFGTATTNGPLVVSLAKNGITSDATNGIDFSATAPAGATGQEAAINAIFAAANTAAGNAGVVIDFDVAVALGAPLYLYSNMTIRARNPQCGAIMRAGANAPIFRLKGMDATVSTNNSTQSQKNFGKIDSTAFGTTTGSTDYRYRVFDPTSINASNVAILGGTWNANGPQQTANQWWNTTYGFVNAMSFWGVDGLTIKDVRVFRSLGYGVHIINARHVVIEDIDGEQTATTTYNNDCIHFNGPCTDIRVSRAKLHCSDDHIALNADDGSSTGAVTSGINWACAGAITDVVIQNLEIWPGRENVTPWGTIRILSCVALVDDVTIRGVRGATSNWAFFVKNYTPTTLTGNGNVGTIIFDDCSVDCSAAGSNGNAVFQIGANAECIQIRNRRRRNATTYPDVRIEGGFTVKNVVIDGWWYQPAGSTNNVPLCEVGGTVDYIKISGRIGRDSSLAAGTAPVLKVWSDPGLSGYGIGTGSVGTAVLDVDANRITNLVDVQAGTLTTLIMRGAHRIAGGGSPVNVASGATITNLVAGNGAYPLAYDHATVALVSGTGTVVRTNDYGESTSPATSYTLTDGGLTSGSINTALPLTLIPGGGGTWPAGVTVTLTLSGVTGTYAAVSGCTVSGSVVTVTGGSTTQAIVNFTPTGAGTATITPTNSGTMTNPSALTYTVSSSTATTFSVALSHSSGAVGASETLTVTPVGGTWPSSRTLAVTQSVTLFSVGSFSQPTGGTSTAVSIPLTVTAAGGPSTVNVTDSGTSAMTSTGGASYTATSSAYLLDSITSPVKAAYSLRKVKSAYAGAAIKVRRSSDNSTQDIGFDGSGNLDTTALSTFVGANNGYIDTWYDQSGNALHLTQAAVTGRQPFIVATGTIQRLGNGTARPCIAWQKAGQMQMQVTLSSGSSAMACSAVGSRTTTTNSFGRMITYVGSTTGTVHDDVSSPVNAILITYSGTAFEGFQGATKSLVTSSTTVPYQAHSVFDGANHTFTLDGTAGTPVAAAGVIPYPGDLCIGSQHIAASSANDWWDGMTAEFVVLTGGAYSSGDQATVRTDQKTYYGTP